MTVADLPSVNATLNGISTVLLVLGYVYIRKGRRDIHMRYMIAALVSSAAFLTTYLIYHYYVGSVPYPKFDWTRPIYFAILIPHVILAGLMTPFIITGVIFAIRRRFEKHRRLMRWVWPVWVFVSITGVIVYLMLYKL
jgi:uncharacterized membrane protein YozB (DUF420 family)